MGEFRSKNSNLSTLPENWCTQYLKHVDSESALRFFKFNPKIHFRANLSQKVQNCPFCLEIAAPSVSRMLIPNLELHFLNFNSKIHFWGNLSHKTQSCLIPLKIRWYSISRLLIPNLDLDFWNSDSKIDFLANLG